jgi:phenylacetate-CoA ligase
VLKGFPVKEAQYVQKSLSEILIRIVKDMSYHDETTNDIVKEVRKRLGSAISINVEFVDNIERGPGGKLRTVISEIRKDLSPHDALIKLS